MGFFHSIAKLASKANPVAKWARDKGGFAGTAYNILDPGAAVSNKVANGAPLNAKTLMDPNNWSGMNPGAMNSAQSAYTPYQPLYQTPTMQPGQTRQQLLAAAMANHQAQMGGAPPAAAGPPMAPPTPPMSGAPMNMGQPLASAGTPNPFGGPAGAPPMQPPMPQNSPQFGIQSKPQMYGKMMMR